LIKYQIVTPRCSDIHTNTCLCYNAAYDNVAADVKKTQPDRGEKSIGDRY